MVETWVRLIEAGEKALDEVPKKLYEKVKARLIEEGWIDEE